jgi:hypothetical protein
MISVLLLLLQGVFEHLASKAEQQPELTGLQVLVEGRVPLGDQFLPPASLCVASVSNHTS